MKRLFVFFSGILVITAILLACGADTTPNTGVAVTPNPANNESPSNGASGNTAAPTAAPTTAPPVQQHFTVGQLVKTGIWEITVNSVRTSQGDQFSQPSAGNIYLIINVTVHNSSNQSQTISSLANFSVKDSTGTKASPGLLTSGVKQAPDGPVEVNGNLSGDFVYEVSASEHQFELLFQSDLLSSDQTIWDIKV